MAADSYSARIGLLKQATGNNNNVWGDKFNSSVTDLLDLALFGIDTRAVTGGTLDLSGGTLPPNGPGPMIGATQMFTGVLTAQQFVTLPNLQGKWTIFNNTTGAFTLIVQTTSGGSGIEIPQGTIKDIFTDGNAVFRKDRDRVGTIQYGGTVPPGALACNGASLLRSAYPYLFAQIGTMFGAVDGTHFTIPLMTDTGRYLRSTYSSVVAGTYQSNQNAAHTHTYSGTTAIDSNDHVHTYSGTTASMNQNATHSHTATVTGSVFGGNSSGGSSGGGNDTVQQHAGIGVTISSTNTDHQHTYSGTTSGVSSFHNHTYSGTTASSGGTDARPETLVAYASMVY